MRFFIKIRENTYKTRVNHYKNRRLPTKNRRMPTCLAVVIYGCQRCGNRWNAESGQPNPEFFGGVMVLELAFRSVVPFAGLFQDCLPRRHHPRVWGFFVAYWPYSAR